MLDIIIADKKAGKTVNLKLEGQIESIYEDDREDDAPPENLSELGSPVSTEGVSYSSSSIYPVEAKDEAKPETPVKKRRKRRTKKEIEADKKKAEEAKANVLKADKPVITDGAADETYITEDTKDTEDTADEDWSFLQGEPEQKEQVTLEVIIDEFKSLINLFESQADGQKVCRDLLKAYGVQTVQAVNPDNYNTLHKTIVDYKKKIEKT